MRYPALVTALLALFAAPLARAGDDDWPRFRGPNGEGTSAAAGIPVRWTEADYNWKVEVPGTGHSSPVLWGDRIFLTTADAATARRTVLCLRAADGGVAWRRDYPSKTYRQHQDNSFATSTPAADAEAVYVTWTTPDEVALLALDHRGSDRWRRDLGPFEAKHGSGTSPIVFENLVVLANDQEGRSFLVAVDRKTGETRWQTQRRTGLAAYSTPCVRQRDDGPPELVFTSTADGLTAVDAATGKVNWQVEKVFLDRCVASPVLAQGLVIAGFGFGNRGTRLVAVRPGAKDSPPALAYDVTKDVPLVPTPLVKDGRLFLWADDGRVTCLDAATGRVLWRERVDGEFYASPVCVQDRLYGVAKNGDVVVLAASEKFELLARVPLGEPCNATPAVAGGVMYLKTRSHLVSLGGKR